MSDPQHTIIVGEAAVGAASDCGCCDDGSHGLPLLVNRPGLSAIAYRAGTHAGFKQAMLAGLSDARRPRLAELRTRDNDDFTIALLDAWATVSDVLTFYQERIANESYLRTATERLSVVELARLIGFKPAPGVAASVALAFTMEEGAGAPEQAIKQTLIPRGTQVQSIPGPGQQAQIFETIEDITARLEWNAMKPRRREPGGLRLALGIAYLDGTAANLKPGDTIAFISEQRLSGGIGPVVVSRISTVQLDHDENRTRITFKPESGVVGTFRCFVFRQRAALFGYNAPDPRSLHADIVAQYTTDIDTTTKEWVGLKITGSVIELDSTYPQIVAGSWLLLGSTLYHVTAVAEASKTAFAINGKTTQVTLESSTGLGSITGAAYRAAVVFAQSEELAFTDQPIDGAVMGSEIALDRAVAAPETGRALFVRGKRARVRVVAASLALSPGDQSSPKVLKIDQQLTLMGPPTKDTPNAVESKWPMRDDDGVVGTVMAMDVALAPVAAGKDDEIVAERVIVKDAPAADSTHTRLVLQTPLVNAYDRWSFEVLGNVAEATHGASVGEILGSGNAAERFQQFTLKQAPLTYVSSASPSGADSTLEVRVSDVLWREVPALYGRGPRERIYTARLRDDGKAVIEFGDGRAGARLPSGQDNVRANYRKGIGTGGLVDAGQLSMLLSRPLGVKGVVNLEPASGAADPASLDDARLDAPIGVLTLDRAVSLRDYEDFARGFAGVAKALATWSWDGQSRRIVVTVAGANGAVIPPDSMLHDRLLAALGAAGDPFVAVDVKSYRRAYFQMALRVKVGDRLADKVLADVEAALRNAFSFAARGFGQTVTMSEVIAVAQAVPDVVAVDLDRLYRTAPPADAPILNPRLPAALPSLDPTGETLGAELLTLTPGPLDALEVMS
jgi:hypothetical protein